MYYYTGIGSRSTPQWALDWMESMAESLANVGCFTLRSGGADGADSAFERGVLKSKNPRLMSIYLPWPKFNGRGGDCYTPIQGTEREAQAYASVKEFHPNSDALVAPAIMARNYLQIYGDRGDHSVSSLLICYTTNGAVSGGTGQALRIANAHNEKVRAEGNYEGLIEIYNLGHPQVIEDWDGFNDRFNENIATSYLG